MRCYVLMGVCGCGKTSVGQALAQAGNLQFVDGDDLHPPENIAKMAQGDPLNDADRLPWLRKVGDRFADTAGPVVIGCSALKRGYRDVIRDHAQEPVTFLHLSAPREVLLQRVSNRPGHFMPATLLDSQLATLEPLDPDEQGALIDITAPFDMVVAQAASCFGKA